MKHAHLATSLLLLITTSLACASTEVVTRTLNNGKLVLQNIPAIPDSLVSDLNRFQNVRSAFFLDWTSGGDAIYIKTRFGKVYQIHRVNQAGGARTQVTFFKEPVGAVARQPGGDLLSITRDSGGSEYAQIFVFDPNSAELRMVSDGESKNGAPVWRPDGKALVYQSTRRNGAANDLWLTEIDQPAKSRLIMTAEDGSWWGPVDWSNDGKQLLVQQYVSVTDSRIFLLDVASGKLRMLRGDLKHGSVNKAIGFDKSESGFYFLSDHASPFAKLQHQKLDQSEARPLTPSIAWDVEHASISDDRERFAFAVNVAGASQIYLLNPATDQYQLVEGLPVGVVSSSLHFSPDGTKLGFSVSAANNPSDSYVLDLGKNALSSGTLRRWTSSEVGGLNTDQFSVPSLITYPSFDLHENAPRQIPAFIYKPRNVTKPLPVIVSLHGGPESQSRPRFSSSTQLWVNKLGAAVIKPNVRGSSGYGKAYVALDNGYKREDSVKDLGALLDWIALQPDLDEQRVILIGGSYGGYMVLAGAVHYSDRLLGAVDVVGISNFVTFLNNTKDYRRDLRRVEYGDERDSRMLAHLQAISPSNNVDKITVPLLVVQGQNDPRVPVTEAEQIVRALRAQGSEVWYLNALNEGHGYRKKDNRNVYQQITVMFMQQLLERHRAQ